MASTDAVAQRIAGYIAGLIPDGATLQTGIGAIPDAVLGLLGNHKHLGVHTELFADGIIDLIQKGVLTGERKTLHPGKVIAGFMLGTQRLYSFVHDNPIIELHPTDYTNDPFIIAQNARMVAINSAIEVDLTGQVCADSIGPRLYSGVGGQVDLHLRRLALSRGAPDHRPARDRARRDGVADRCHAQARRRGHHHAQPHPVRGHRVRRGLAVRQDDSPARACVDRHRRDEVPRRPGAGRLRVEVSIGRTKPFGAAAPLRGIASTRALMSEPDGEPYGAAKGGLLALTHALAISLGGFGIRVNAISPGWIFTKGEPPTPDDHAQHPARRVGRPEDVAAAALFLADHRASGFMTGQNLVLDGGMTVKMIYL